MLSHRARLLLLASLLLTGLQGCAASSESDSEHMASDAGLAHQEIVSSGFRLTTYSRITDTNQPVNLYIDGDIRGWAPTTDPGIDATPDTSMGLRLASLDPSANVVYLSAPCQFNAEDSICADLAKSDGRYAEQIVTSLNRAVDHFMITIPQPKINLVGYSGGGAIAAVLAARRHDVASLRTIAGNLDPDGDGRCHATDPQDDFVDPIALAPRLAALPQEHLVGGKDVFVPPFLTENFVKTIGASYCVKVTVFPDATHQTGWENIWSAHASHIPACDRLTR